MNTANKSSSKRALRAAGPQCPPHSADQPTADGALAARIAHEINNPLDGLLRYLNLSVRRAAETSADEALLEYLEKARDAALRLSEVTRELLGAARQPPESPRQATLNRIVADALEAMTGSARARGIAVTHLPADRDWPMVRGSHLFQVFCNLIKNAVDAMPDGGRLDVSAQTDDRRAVVRVADTGIGLPAEAHRIFEPFFTTKPPGQGTGLGLAICKDLIERFGGSIEASPNAPKGTVMTVTIPLKNCAARNAKPDFPAPGMAGA